MKPFLALLACFIALPGTVAAQTSAAPDLTAFAAQCHDIALEPEPRIAACNAGLAATDDPAAQAWLLIGRGATHRQHGAYDAAEADFLSARDLHPGSPAAYRNMAFTEDDRGNPGLAMNWALRAIEADPGDPRAFEAFFYMAAISDDQGICHIHLDRALAVLPPVDLTAWTTLPEQYGFLVGDIGICLRALERNAEAFTAYRAADALGLDEAYNRRNLAFLAYLVEEDDLAQQVSLDTLERDGPHIDPIFALAGSYAFTGRFADAAMVLEQYHDFFRAEGYDDGAHNLVGWQAFVAGEHEIALAVMENWHDWYMSLDAPPAGEGPSWDTLAQARTATGDVEDAMAAFERSIEEFDPPSDQIAFLRHTLGRLGYAPGEGDAALMATLRTCVETGPDCRLVADDDWMFPSER